jgi:Ni/Co efflux regulator RcnB
MKLAFAATALSLLLASASGAQEANKSVGVAPDANQKPNAAAHVFAVGDRVPGGFVASRNTITDPSKYSLPKAELDQRWLKIETNAYLIDSRNDHVIAVYPIKD